MKRIIITDDEIMNLRMTEFILKKAGYETVKAASGAECLNAVREQRPDLILLDLLMPEMDGFQVIEKLRKSEEGRDIPIILLTAAEDRESLDRAAEMGVAACVGKPFKQEELLSKIQTALG
ncbi:MAG: response regulator [Huintestinicola sp.]|uniref:response regulator n=1 Tax=Huintestinicola sp. TaxID=2981661 RepID=UPI003F048D27